METFEYGTTEIVLTVVLSVVVYVYYGITAGRIFAKAGVAAWQAWVPFLNSWRLLELGGKAGAWLLIVLVPIVGQVIYLVVYLIAQFHIGKALGKSGVFLLLAILVSPVWFGILAFDSSAWRPLHTPRIPHVGALTVALGVILLACVVALVAILVALHVLATNLSP